MTRFEHKLHAVIYPAEDLPGQWIAHCLEFDVVTQGDNQAHAIEMLDDALKTIAHSNVEDGVPLFNGLMPASPEDWALFERGERLSTHILRIDDAKTQRDLVIEPHVARAG